MTQPAPLNSHLFLSGLVTQTANQPASQSDGSDSKTFRLQGGDDDDALKVRVEKKKKKKREVDWNGCRLVHKLLICCNFPAQAHKHLWGFQETVP